MMNPRHNENVQESLGTRTLKDGSVHRMRGRALQASGAAEGGGGERGTLGSIRTQE